MTLKNPKVRDFETDKKFLQFRLRTLRRGALYGSLLTSGFFLAMKYSSDGTIFKRKDEKQDLVLVRESLETEGVDEEKLSRGRLIMRFGRPDVGLGVRYYGNHVLTYDQQKRIPMWVGERITNKDLTGTANRKYSKFKADPSVEVMFSAQNEDYWKSGWSRGHMAPAGDSKFSQEAMNESFYLSNVVPQNYENNAGFWNRLEMYCRDLTKRFGGVYIFSGPVFLPSQNEDGTKYVKYQVIGKNNVAVPTHLFKVIVTEYWGKPAAIGAFIIPNEPIGFDRELKEFQVELQDLEKIVGFKILPELDIKNLKNLCGGWTGCKLIGKKEFELYFIGRRLESANTLHRLERVWAELEEKQLKPDSYLKSLYDTKRKELENQENKDEKQQQQQQQEQEQQQKSAAESS